MNIKTVFFLLFSNMLLPVVVYSQAPDSFKYQSVIRKSNGAIFENQTIRMRISILKGGISGSVVYSEMHQAVSNSFGIINLTIGGGLDKIGTISAIDWSNDSHFIKVEIDETGGSNFTLSSVSQLLSVPFALYSNTSGAIEWANVKNKPSSFVSSYNDLVNKPNFLKWDKDSTDNVTKNGDQTIAGNKSFNGTVKVPTPVSDLDAANKAYVDMLELRISSLEAHAGLAIKDADNNYYHMTTIGTQVWMVENLKTTKLNDGTPISLVENDLTWATTMGPAMSWYNDDAPTYKDAYGGLYNGYLVQTNKLCPVGWHVPTQGDWQTLEDFLGGINGSGGKLKEAGTSHWRTPNATATNETKFTALPGGLRYYADGVFGDLGMYGYWWSSSLVNVETLLYRHMSYVVPNFYKGTATFRMAFSVRCIQD